MAVLIDPPRWPAHGRLWSHLVSDEALEELHAFAARVGVPRRGFEGDHYDVPAERYADIVAAGAQPVPARELLARLVASGLRVPKRRGERVVASRPVPAEGHVDVVVSPLWSPSHSTASVAAVVTDRHLRVLVVARAGGRADLPGGAREEGESAAAAAARHVTSLTGVLLTPAALRPYGFVRRRPAAGGWSHHGVLRAAVAGPEPSAAAWWPVQRAAAALRDEETWPLVRRVLALP